MTKEEIIANLYSLRAGLSVVTQEKRHIDKQKKIAEENERSSRTALDDERTEKISEAEEALFAAEEKFYSAQNDYNYKESIYLDTESRAEHSMTRAQNKDSLARLKIFFGFLLYIFIILLALTIIAYGFMIFLSSFYKPDDLPKFFKINFLKKTMSWAFGKGYMAFVGIVIMAIGGVAPGALLFGISDYFGWFFSRRISIMCPI